MTGLRLPLCAIWCVRNEVPSAPVSSGEVVDTSAAGDVTTTPSCVGI